MASASSALSATRALQTWQITLGWRLSSLTCVSSRKPSSRSRSHTSGAVASCRTQTVVPASMRLNGHTTVPAHWPARILKCGDGFLFTGTKVVGGEMRGKKDLPRSPPHRLHVLPADLRRVKIPEQPVVVRHEAVELA